MTLQQQLERYDIKAGDLIEFTDGEIWLYRGFSINALTCLKGSFPMDRSVSHYQFEMEDTKGKVVKRVMRTDWNPFTCRIWDHAGEIMMTLLTAEDVINRNAIIGAG